MATSGTHERQQKWKAGLKRRTSATAERLQKEADDLIECTFEPKLLNRTQHSPRGQVHDTAAQKAHESHVNRLARARRDAAHAERGASKFAWKNVPTEPQPFKLSTGRRMHDRRSPPTVRLDVHDDTKRTILPTANAATTVEDESAPPATTVPDLPKEPMAAKATAAGSDGLDSVVRPAACVSEPAPTDSAPASADSLRSVSPTAGQRSAAINVQARIQEAERRAEFRIAQHEIELRRAFAKEREQWGTERRQLLAMVEALRNEVEIRVEARRTAERVAQSLASSVREFENRLLEVDTGSQQELRKLRMMLNSIAQVGGTGPGIVGGLSSSHISAHMSLPRNSALGVRRTSPGRSHGEADDVAAVNGDLAARGLVLAVEGKMREFFVGREQSAKDLHMEIIGRLDLLLKDKKGKSSMEESANRQLGTALEPSVNPISSLAISGNTS